HTQATGGAMELLMLAGERRGVKPVHLRTVLEISILGAGVALEGAFAPFTVITALALGPSIAVALQGLADHRTGRQIRRATPPAPPGLSVGDSSI
ncbi:MAG: hypothetical protein P8N02_08655, partial [Actinomycetota bacterium]|nr:hypothetical protein [Actinomycetota bacterium]